MTDTPGKMARRCADAAASYILGNRWILASAREGEERAKEVRREVMRAAKQIPERKRTRKEPPWLLDPPEGNLDGA